MWQLLILSLASLFLLVQVFLRNSELGLVLSWPNVWRNTWMKQLIRRIWTKIPNLTEFLVMRKGEWSGRTTWYRLLVSYSHWSWVHFFQFLLRGVGCIIAKYILLDIILSFQNIQPFPSCNFDMKYLYSIFT